MKSEQITEQRLKGLKMSTSSSNKMSQIMHELASMIVREYEILMIGKSGRRIVNLYDKALLIIQKLKKSISWSLLEAYTGVKSLFYCFKILTSLGLVRKIFNSFKGVSCRDENSVDSTYSKAFQCASGGTKGAEKKIGVSRGGRSSKIHLLVDKFGYPIDYEITAGNVGDNPIGVMLLKRNLSNDIQTTVLADKAYDADDTRKLITESGGIVVIPPRANRTTQFYIDKEIYKRRNIVERAFRLIKGFPAIALRREKLAKFFETTVLLSLVIRQFSILM